MMWFHSFYTPGENIRHKSWSLFPAFASLKKNKNLSVLFEMSIFFHFSTCSFTGETCFFVKKDFYIHLRLKAADNNYRNRSVSRWQADFRGLEQKLKHINVADLNMIHRKEPQILLKRERDFLWILPSYVMLWWICVQHPFLVPFAFIFCVWWLWGLLTLKNVEHVNQWMCVILCTKHKGECVCYFKLNRF